MIKLKKILNLILEVSYNYLYSYTPKDYRQRASGIKSKFLTRTKHGKYFYETRTIDNGHIHRQWIKPARKNRLTGMNQDVMVWCDCPNFLYDNEYVLWKANASRIVNSNGNPPIIRNPRRVKKLCKHLIADMQDLKKRI